MADANGNGPRKKRRVEFDDDELFNDEFSDEKLLAEVDFAISQACSQAPTSVQPPKTDFKFQRHHSWTGTSSPSENVEPRDINILCKTASKSGSDNRETKLKTLGFLNTPKVFSLASANTQIVSQRSDESERYKHEITCLKKEKLQLEEKLKKVNETLSEKDHKIAALQQDKSDLRERWCEEQREKRLQVEENEKLKTELQFKKQELTSGQWTANLQQHIRQAPKLNSSQSVLSQHRRNTTKPLPADYSSNSFPNSQTFTKKLDGVKAATDNFKLHVGTSAELIFGNSSNSTTAGAVLKLPRPLGLETGPGLVGILLQDTAGYWNNAVLATLNVPKQNEAMLGGNKMDLEASVTNKKYAASLPVISQHISDVSAEFNLGLRSLLKDAEVLHPNSFAELLPKNSRLQRCLGLIHDSCEAFMPFLEKTLCSQWSAGIGYNNCDKTGPSGQLNTSEYLQRFHPLYILNVLKVLKQLVCYSPNVCRWLANQLCLNFENPTNGAFAIAGPSHGPKEETALPSESPSNVMQMMFSAFGNQLLDFEDPFSGKLLLTTLEVFHCVANSLEVVELKEFLPLLNTNSLKSCLSLKWRGEVLLEFVHLLGVLCSSAQFVRSTCDQEFCLWIPLSEVWQKAKDILAKKQMLALNSGMINLLSRCLVHMSVGPPFLVTAECQCPFEVIPAVIVYLHGQRSAYEKDATMMDFPTFQNAVSLLNHIAHKDCDFHYHRQAVDDEFVSFLHWLPTMHKMHNLGSAAEGLFEMWGIDPSDMQDSDQN